MQFFHDGQAARVINNAIKLNVDYLTGSATNGFLFTRCKTLKNERESTAQSAHESVF